MKVSKALIIAALCCFGLAAVGVSLIHVALVPLGLALYTASKLA
jgi:hypothetical protein